MTLYLMLTMIKREHKRRVLNRMGSILMELMLVVLIMLSIGEQMYICLVIRHVFMISGLQLYLFVFFLILNLI